MTPPAVHKHGFCPFNVAMMLRCPIGGGTCKYGVLNAKSLRHSIQAHFYVHHRSVPLNFSEIKIDAHRGGFFYINYPVSAGQARVAEPGATRLGLEQVRGYNNPGKGRLQGLHSGKSGAGKGRGYGSKGHKTEGMPRGTGLGA